MYEISGMQPFGAIVTREGSEGSLLDIPVDELSSLVEEYKVLVLRGFTRLSKEDFGRAARRLGPLLEWEFGEILDLKINKTPANHLFGTGRVELHWDGAYLTEVPRFNLFQCLESSQDAGGGETLFVDTVKLVDQATETQRAQWKDVVIDYRTEKAAHYSGSVTVPLIGSHVGTGAENLRFIEPYNEDNEKVNPVFINVHNMESGEQGVFLSELIERLYADDVMYRHRWQSGDFLLVDNNAVLHGRAKLEGNIHRHLQRIHVMDPSAGSTRPQFIGA